MKSRNSVLLCFVTVWGVLIGVVKGYDSNSTRCMICDDTMRMIGDFNNFTVQLEVSDFSVNNGGSENNFDFFVSVNLDHSYLEDLFLTVSQDGGTSVQIWNNECGSVADLSAVFFDDGSDTVENQGRCADSNALTVYARPDELFASQDVGGSSKTGIYSIFVADQEEGDMGRMNQVCVGWLTNSSDSCSLNMPFNQTTDSPSAIPSATPISDPTPSPSSSIIHSTTLSTIESEYPSEQPTSVPTASANNPSDSGFWLDLILILSGSLIFLFSLIVLYTAHRRGCFRSNVNDGQTRGSVTVKRSDHPSPRKIPEHEWNQSTRPDMYDDSDSIAKPTVDMDDEMVLTVEGDMVDDPSQDTGDSSNEGNLTGIKSKITGRNHGDGEQQMGSPKSSSSLYVTVEPTEHGDSTLDVEKPVNSLDNQDDSEEGMYHAIEQPPTQLTGDSLDRNSRVAPFHEGDTGATIGTRNPHSLKSDYSSDSDSISEVSMVTDQPTTDVSPIISAY